MGGYAGDSGDSAPHGTPPQRAPAQRVMDAAPLLGVQFLRREGRGHLQPAHGQQLGAPRRQILSSMDLVSLVSKYIQQIADFLKAIMGPGNRTQTWATFHSQEIK